jgi:hypothetical protein
VLKSVLQRAIAFSGVVLLIPVTALSSAAAPAASSSSSSSSKPAASSVARRAGSELVTLVTGDRVWVSGTGSGAAVRIETAASSGPAQAMQTLRTPSGVYVIPAVAQPYLGTLLDRELFNVTRLSSAAAHGTTTATSPIQVRMAYGSTKPAVPGVKITSAAHGQAQGYLTRKSSLAFGRALTAQWKADAKAGWPRHSSLFAGVTKLSGQAPATVAKPAAVAKVPLTFTVIAADGQPSAAGEVTVLSTDSLLGDYDLTATVKNGVAKVSLPKGHYSAVGVDFTGPSAQQVIRVVPISDFTMTAARALTIDYRTATLAPSASVPQQNTQLNYAFGWLRYDAGLSTPYGVDLATGKDGKIFLAPQAPVTRGRLSVGHSWQLAQPGGTAAYTYDLAVLASSIPADQQYTFNAADLATVTSTYAGDGSAATGGFERYASFAGEGATSVDYQPVELGGSRTEYVGSRGGTPLWYESALANSSTTVDDRGQVDDLVPQVIRAGSQSTRAWFQGPMTPGIPAFGVQDGGFCFACRGKKTLSLMFAPLSDSAPDHFGQMQDASDGLPVIRFRFYTNGKKIKDTQAFDYDLGESASIGATFKVATTKATYKAVLDVDRRAQAARQATVSRTTVTFPSASGAGILPPSDWSCLASNFNCRVLPVLLAKLSLPTTTGTLPAGTSTISLNVARTQHAAHSPITSARLAIRIPGKAWKKVTLAAAGSGRYTATIDNTGFAGSPVDVQISAADQGGSTFAQTILHAYTVAGS